MQKTSETHAKFPTRGKLIDYFMKNLEIQYTNDADRKRYQRFVNEENITINEYNEVLEYCIDSILDELLIDKVLIASAKTSINTFLVNYMKNITEVEIFRYTQESINPVLKTSIFLPFLIFFNHYYIKVDVAIFSTSNNSPLKNIFNLLNQEDLASFLFHKLDILTDNQKADETLHQNINNWLTAKNYPNRKYQKHLSDIFSKILSIDIRHIEQLFIVGKLLSEMEHLKKEELDLNSSSFSTSKELEKKIEDICEPQLNNIRPLLLDLYSLSHLKNEKTIVRIKRFEKSLEKLKLQGYTAENSPYIALAQARLYAQQKEFKNSKKYYLLALTNAKNSLGIYYVDIIKEGLIVSAQITREKSLTLDNSKSPFVKFYKEAYFSNTITSLPSEISQFFLNDYKKKFSIYFKNLYPHAESKKENFKSHEHGFINQKELEKIKLDLKNPNKKIKNMYPNPFSQLMHFSMLLQYDKVIQLLKAGANPNEMRFNDNSTALTIILLNDNLNEEKLKVAKKLSKLLISKMSKEALNAKLPKKRATALSLAIERGYVDIVKLLIEKGADINQLVEINNVSPLYLALMQIYLSTGKNHIDGLKNYVEPTDQTIINRKNHYTDTLSPFFQTAITDKEKTNKFNHQEYAELKELFQEMSSSIMQKEYNEKKESYFEIFYLLLDANPNLEIHIDETGHTVLIFATEINEVEIVKKLIEKGANREAKTLQGNRAIDYARSYHKKKNIELIEILRND